MRLMLVPIIIACRSITFGTWMDALWIARERDRGLPSAWLLQLNAVSPMSVKQTSLAERTFFFHFPSKNSSVNVVFFCLSQGLRLEVCTSNRQGLLSDITRVFREHGLSITRAHITTSDDGDTAIGTFYVTDASGNEVDPKTVESVRKEIGGSVLTVPHSPSRVHHPHPHSDTTTTAQQKFSLGSLLWSQLERLSSNFGSINS